jgi:hypothetical protein
MYKKSANNAVQLSNTEFHEQEGKGVLVLWAYIKPVTSVPYKCLTESKERPVRSAHYVIKCSIPNPLQFIP